MEIDHEEQLYDNEKFRLLSDYFAYTRNKLSDSKLPILMKDTNFEYSYILNSPVYIINSNTYEIARRINFPENINLIDLRKVLAFTYKNESYLLSYSQNSIFICSLTNGMNEVADHNIIGLRENTFSEMKLKFLKDDEEIVKIYFINNEVRYM
jgi:hypothetical protein